MSENKSKWSATLCLSAILGGGCLAAFAYNKYKKNDDIIHESSYPPVVVPEDKSLQEYLFGLDTFKAAENAGLIAFVDGITKKETTYKEFKATVRAVGAGLHKMGVKKGDMVAIWCHNCPEYAFMWHGVGLIGAIVTTLNPIYTEEEVANQLKDSTATYLFTLHELLPKASAAAAKAGGIKKTIVLGGPAPVGGVTYEELIAGGDAGLPTVHINPKTDLMVLPYSSGTTGLPKGVMLSHYNIIANTLQHIQSRIVEPKPKECYLGNLPMFHIYGMTNLLAVYLTNGSTIVTLPAFDPPKYLQLLQDYKIEMVHTVPPLVNFLAKHPMIDQYKLCLKEVACGAAPLGEELSDLCRKRLGLQIMRQGYGMTEMSPTVLVSTVDSKNFGSVGPLFPSVRAKVVDVDTGAALGPNQRGELWCAGPNIMLGYWNNAAATAETLDADGFLHTGDICYVDDNGEFYIVDRLKELIKVKAFQVAPAELEAILLVHPDIADAAVMGVPAVAAGGRDGDGEVPKAYITLKPQVSLSAEQIMAYVKEKVAVYKQIKIVEFMEKIPKTASGKILRKDLKKMEADRQK